MNGCSESQDREWNDEGQNEIANSTYWTNVYTTPPDSSWIRKWSNGNRISPPKLSQRFDSLYRRSPPLRLPSITETLPSGPFWRSERVKCFCFSPSPDSRLLQ